MKEHRAEPAALCLFASHCERHAWLSCIMANVQQLHATIDKRLHVRRTTL
jgi:hypothetical protein